MKVDVSEKFFWFVFFELLCGFVASVVWMDYGYSGGGNNADYTVIHGVLISGGFFPVVFRSMHYTFNKKMGKAASMTLMITALCMYIVGGVIWLIDKGNAVRGVFGLAAGGILMADLICTALNK